jgi:hypothetical protein
MAVRASRRVGHERRLRRSRLSEPKNASQAALSSAEARAPIGIGRRPRGSARRSAAKRTGALVGVVNEPRLWLAATDGHLERLDHERSAHVLRHRRADRPPAKQSSTTAR